MMITRACLYTHQKLKKKKTFQDGVLKLHPTRLTAQLFSLKATQAKLGSLETRNLAPEEMKGVISGEISELEFEGFLVEVEDTPQGGSRGGRGNTPQQPAISIAIKQRVGAFKPPSAVAPPPPPPPQRGNIGAGGLSSLSSSSRFEGRYPSAQVSSWDNDRDNYQTYAATSGSGYNIEDDELDDLWGDAAQTPAAAATAAPAPAAPTNPTQKRRRDDIQGHVKAQRTDIFNAPHTIQVPTGKDRPGSSSPEGKTLLSREPVTVADSQHTVRYTNTENVRNSFIGVGLDGDPFNDPVIAASGAGSGAGGGDGGVRASDLF